MKNMISANIVWIAPIVLLLLALMHLPYGYYIFLRIVVCICALVVAWRNWGKSSTYWAWIFCAVAVIFNPVESLRLPRTLWAVINIVSAAIFAENLRRIKKSKK